MRALVFLLVLGNLVFFAYARGYFGQPDNPDAVRMTQQLQPDKVVVVARGEAPPIAPPPAAVQGGEGREAGAEGEACLQWEGLGEREADQLAEAAKALASPGAIERYAAPVSRTRHWVRIGELASRALAERKAAEATRMGVREHEVVADGAQWALSMGVFSTREAAEAHLAGLRKKGIRSAAIAEKTDSQARLRVVWRGPAPAADPLRQALRTAPGACPAAGAQAAAGAGQ